MGYEEGKRREQQELCPPSLEEQIAMDHPVRVIDAFVDGLEMSVLGFKKAEPAWTGRPGYDPRDLLKLYLYGYINRVRSSRRLQRECERNIEVKWLINSLEPDFRTISDFRKDNRLAVKETFKAFVTVLREAKLLGEELTVDGTRIRANNSIKRSFTPEVTAKKLQYIEEQIGKLEAYLNEMDSYDEREETLHLDIPREQMPEKLKELKERAKKYRGFQARFQEGEKQILETDPECRTLHSKDGLHPAYNVQTVTDTAHHFITNFETVTANNDQGQLRRMGEVVKEELERDVVHLIADKGYESRQDIEECLMNGIIPDVGLKYDKKERVFNLDYLEADITPEQKASTRPEDIKACLHAGVLPDCYEGSNIRVEVQERGVLSCFIRHEDGTVTCPMGRTLYKHQDKQYGTQYGSREACRTCPNRCTDAKGEKTVLIGYNSNVVPVLMYGHPEYPLQQLPRDYVISPNNHSLHRKGQAKETVKITIKRDKARQQVRKETAEHPFGTVKWYDGMRCFLCRGKEKVAAETALAYTSYNIRRAINLTTPAKGMVPGILMHLRQRVRIKMATM